MPPCVQEPTETRRRCQIPSAGVTGSRGTPSVGPGPPEEYSDPQCWSYRESCDSPLGCWELNMKSCWAISQPPFYLSFQTNYQSLWQASKSVLIIFFFFLQVRDVIRRLLREISSYPSTTYGLLFLVCVSGRLAYCPLHLSVLIMTVCTRVNGKALEVEGDWNSSDSSTSEHAIEHCWALESVRMSKSYHHPVWVSTKQRNRAKRVRRWTFSSGSETMYLLPGQQNSRLFCS